MGLGVRNCGVLIHDHGLVTSLQLQTTRPQTLDLHGFFIQLLLTNHGLASCPIAQNIVGGFASACVPCFSSLLSQPFLVDGGTTSAKNFKMQRKRSKNMAARFSTVGKNLPSEFCQLRCFPHISKFQFRTRSHFQMVQK